MILSGYFGKENVHDGQHINEEKKKLSIPCLQ